MSTNSEGYIHKRTHVQSLYSFTRLSTIYTALHVACCAGGQKPLGHGGDVRLASFGEQSWEGWLEGMFAEGLEGVVW